MAESELDVLEKVGNRHQATIPEQRNLGHAGIYNLDPDWWDDHSTSGAAEVYSIGPGSVPRDVVPLVFDSGPVWPR